VTVKALPSNVLKSLQNVLEGGGVGGGGKGVMSEEEAEEKLQTLPADLLECLMPFQRLGVKFAGVYSTELRLV